MSCRHEMAELRAELRQETTGLRSEFRQEMADLRHTLELNISSTVTQPLGQMALLLEIAYFFVTHLQH